MYYTDYGTTSAYLLSLESTVHTYRMRSTLRCLPLTYHWLMNEAAKM